MTGSTDYTDYTHCIVSILNFLMFDESPFDDSLQSKHMDKVLRDNGYISSHYNSMCLFFEDINDKTGLKLEYKSYKEFFSNRDEYLPFFLYALDFFNKSNKRDFNI
jgi:hypothetical protein